MTRAIRKLILAGILILGAPTLAAAQSDLDAGERIEQTPTPAPADHAVRGVVKTVSPTMLVIARSGKRGDITFVLTSSTSRAGTIAPGVTVSVRYRTEGTALVATAVTSRTDVRH